uniref:Uncharacterized protein n=1 Tax=Podoviridae sp. ctjUd6 TaxID=2825270 RepID=A0A8S5U2R2_9CAUD|nr:MAG TPA: hypothetical protein [Podoviridae sp. ctjUd6]
MHFEPFEPHAWAEAVRAAGWRAAYQVTETVSGMLSIRLTMIGHVTIIAETDGYVTTLRGIGPRGEDFTVTPGYLIGMLGEEAVPDFITNEETVTLLKGNCHD